MNEANCKGCDGSGRDYDPADHSSKRCSDCNGSGKQNEPLQTEHTKPQPAPKQDEDAPALWPLIIAEIEGPFGRIANAPSSRAASVERLMVDDMRARHEFGLAKYGVPLVAHNDRDHLSDAYQETLDGVVYLRAEIEKRGGMNLYENQALVDLYMAQFRIAFGIRELLARRDGR